MEKSHRTLEEFHRGGPGARPAMPGGGQRCVPVCARVCVRACVCPCVRTRTRLWAVCPPQFFASSPVACGLSARGGQGKDFKRPLGLLDFLRLLKIVGSNWVQIPANLVQGSSPSAPACVRFASGYCKQTGVSLYSCLNILSRMPILCFPVALKTVALRLVQSNPYVIDFLFQMIRLFIFSPPTFCFCHVLNGKNSNKC